MRLRDNDRARELIARLRTRRVSRSDDITAEWFAEQRSFYDDSSALIAAMCGRRAGKTRGGCRHFVREARRIHGARLLYLNSTRGEAERLAWHGNRADGMASLVTAMGLVESGEAKLNASDLTIHFPGNDGWIFLRGADDEAEVRKALGGAYHEVWWDEAQKIPPKLAPTIREVFMPALLDFGGRFRLTGSPVRQMSGLFYDVTRPDKKHRARGWSVHEWNLLANPFFGATVEERMRRGMIGLQTLYGGPDVAPLDSPIMLREGFGRWTREDAAFVYAVNKVPTADLFYARPRWRPDGFPDIAEALLDLPYDWQEAFFSLGVDIGYYPDPFAFVLWSWHPHDRTLYEVASWKKTHLTSDEQAAVISAVRSQVGIGIVAADAGGPAKPTVKGWSNAWVERYGTPIIEADKHHKHDAIALFNTDLITIDPHTGKPSIRCREDSPWYEEASQLQWATIVSATGKLVEDPTLANHCTDGGLYAHRHSYAHRALPEDKPPPPGSPEHLLQIETEIEESFIDDEDEASSYH